MEAHQRGRFQKDRGTNQPAWAYEERADADDHAISEAEIGCTCPGTIEDQPLWLDEPRFGDHGPCAAGTGESGDCRQQMNEEDGQVAHGAIVAS